MIKCPNKNLPEWKELVEVVGENKAYYLWDQNNGYGLDKTPNGQPSKLFSDLLSHYNGDRNAAIQTKAKVYSEAFKNWFGDWLSDDKTNVSKVVDENGEPLIVYHGGARDINTFRISSEEGTTARGHYTDPITGEKIPVDSARSIFFSDNKYVGVSYATLYAIEQFQSLYNRVQSLIGTVYDGKARIDTGVFKTLDYFLDTLQQLSEFNPRFEALKNYIIEIRKRNQKLNPREIEAFREMLIQVRSDLKPLQDQYLMNRPDWEDVLNRAKKLLEIYNTPEGIRRLISGEIPETIRKEFSLYKKIEQQRERQGLLKIANYEDLHLTLSSEGRYYLYYDGNELKLYTPDYSDPVVSNLTEDKLKKLLDQAYQSNTKSIKNLQ